MSPAAQIVEAALDAKAIVKTVLGAMNREAAASVAS
jgi:hypothetical protein